MAIICTLPLSAQIFNDTEAETNIVVPDSTVPADEFQPNPKLAWKFSALLPSSGQFYNRTYVKGAIVVGGFVALGYAFAEYQDQYADFRDEYICRLDTTCLIITQDGTDSDILAERDFNRRQRDTVILIGAAWYALNIVDAYVTAHLKTFDVSDDLSLQVKPTLMRTGTNGGLGLSLNFGIR